MATQIRLMEKGIIARLKESGASIRPIGDSMWRIITPDDKLLTWLRLAYHDLEHNKWFLRYKQDHAVMIDVLDEKIMTTVYLMYD